MEITSVNKKKIRANPLGYFGFLGLLGRLGAIIHDPVYYCLYSLFGMFGYSGVRLNRINCFTCSATFIILALALYALNNHPVQWFIQGILSGISVVVIGVGWLSQD